MTPLVANVIALVAGIVLALALVAIGASRVAKIGLALKKRAEEYKTLPITVYIDRTERQVGIATRGIENAPALVYRARAALREIANARAKIVDIATSPSAIWRLGELFVTGK